jgi:hypothetical protein
VVRCMADVQGHDGRRGACFASNCEAHRDTRMRFINNQTEGKSGRGGGNGTRARDGVDAIGLVVWSPGALVDDGRVSPKFLKGAAAAD